MCCFFGRTSPAPSRQCQDQVIDWHRSCLVNLDILKTVHVQIGNAKKSTSPIRTSLPKSGRRCFSKRYFSTEISQGLQATFQTAEYKFLSEIFSKKPYKYAMQHGSVIKMNRGRRASIDHTAIKCEPHDVCPTIP